MNITEALTQLRDQGTTTLKVYWIENVKTNESCWWIDVCEDVLDALCATRWAWDILSKAEVDRSIRDDRVDYSKDEDGCVIIVDETFSEDVVKNAINEWLKARGFEFEINIIDPEGTVEMNHIMEMVGEIKDSECCIKYPIDEIWDAEDAIEASATETGL